MNAKKLVKYSLAIVGASSLLVDTSSFATLVTATGIASDSSGNTISASANFQELGGNQLQVTLTSTTPNSTTLSIGEVLYGVYFSGGTGLNLVSATAPSGTKVWNLHSSTTPTTLTSSETISDWKASSFNGLSGATALGGGNQSYGILNTDYNGTGNLNGKNGGLKNSGHNPYIDQIVLLFNYTTFDTNNIGNTIFRFGTTTDFIETHTSSVPEPSTVVAGALILLPFGISTLRILRKNKIS